MGPKHKSVYWSQNSHERCSRHNLGPSVLMEVVAGRVRAQDCLYQRHTQYHSRCSLTARVWPQCQLNSESFHMTKVRNNSHQRQCWMTVVLICLAPCLEHTPPLRIWLLHLSKQHRAFTFTAATISPLHPSVTVKHTFSGFIFSPAVRRLCSCCLQLPPSPPHTHQSLSNTCSPFSSSPQLFCNCTCTAFHSF